MATEIVGGQRSWSGSIDVDGNRTWQIVYQTQGNAGDGPAVHVQTPGLPVEGSIWSFDNDIDIWAWCRSGPTSISPRTGEGTVNTHFDISYTFSTKPDGTGDVGTGPQGGSSPSGGSPEKSARKKCADAKIEDPLQEPPATSGSSVRYIEAVCWDLDGNPLVYTSFEKIVGPPAEFDKHRSQVIVEMNTLNLDYEATEKMVDTLNDAPLWGMPKRFWKFSDWTWSRKSYGACSFYYTKRYTFECSAIIAPLTIVGDDADHSVTEGELVSGHDRFVLDESNKVLNGSWKRIFGIVVGWSTNNMPDGTPPNPNRADHYNAALDRQYQPARLILSRTLKGQPASDPFTDANFIFVRYYQESNLLNLGIPTFL